MRALVKAEAAVGLVLREEERPVPEADEVLVRVRRTSICGTDLHIWNWDDWAARTIPVPLVVGHEWAGEIVEVGSRVRDLHEGMRVSGEGHVVGGHSRMSRAGRLHLDPETRGIGVNLPGAFAEYLKLPAFNVIPLPESVDDELGSILDPLGNAVHAALSFGMAGEDVLITGAGPIGIMAAAVARKVGARHVVITDINPYRLKLASSVADVVPVDVSRETLAEVMQRLGMREGFDVGLEMSGVPQAFEQMFDSMLMGGRIALLGIPAAPFAVDWSRLIFKALQMKAIYGREIFDTWYKTIALIESGLEVRGVITHRLPAAEFEHAFALMNEGACGKVVLNWD